jgi:phosphohistidine phosphatase
MRYVTIVRHCESFPAKSGESDYERVLSDKGKDQTQQLRSWAMDSQALAKYGPTTALVSSAARTRETFKRAFEDTPFVKTVNFSELIYNGKRDVSAEDLLIDLAAIDSVVTSLLLVAHNPSVHELVFSLTQELPDVLKGEYPLGGAFVLAIPDNQQIGLVQYELVDSFIPD